MLIVEQPFADVIEEAERQMTDDYAPPRMKRDAHPKAHGCVQAMLTVHRVFHADVERVEGRNDVRHFRHGVLSTPDKTYKAWVRFSNAFRIQHDLEAETRGMAVKLLDVEGIPILEPDGVPIPETEVFTDAAGNQKYTQDFLFATHDAFFLPDPSEYLEFTQAVRTAPNGVMAFYRDRMPRLWRGAVALFRSQFMRVWNPLALTYFSQTPYRLGPEPVKLRIRPTTPELRISAFRWFGFTCIWLLANFVFHVLEPFTQKGKAWAERMVNRHLADRDFLRLTMMRFLEEHDATFELRIQPYTDDEQTPIDDATKPWKPRQQDYAVATLRIPRQVFWPVAGMPERLLGATNRMVSLGENMSFSPWHGLEDHRPLGSINESRRWIYKEIARFRREVNHVTPGDMPQEQVRQYEPIRKTVREGRIKGRIR
jgi:hypothetical protein